MKEICLKKGCVKCNNIVRTCLIGENKMQEIVKIFIWHLTIKMEQVKNTNIQFYNRVV